MNRTLANRLGRLEQQARPGDEAAWRRPMDECVFMIMHDPEGQRLMNMLGPFPLGRPPLTEAERLDVARRLDERLEELQAAAGVEPGRRGLPRRP